MQFLDKDKTSITGLFSKDILTEEAIYELNKIEKIEPKFHRNDFIYKTGDTRKKIKYMIFHSLKQ